MKKRIAIIVIVLAVIIGVAALVIISRPKTIRVHCYRTYEIDYGIYEDTPVYWNKEMQQWVKVWDDSPIPERLLSQIPNLDYATIIDPNMLWCVEGFTPWDYWFGDGIPHIERWRNQSLIAQGCYNVNGEKCKVEFVYEY